MQSRAFKNVLLLVSIVFMVIETANARPREFGRQWVRQHPFQLFGLVVLNRELDITRYQQASFNSVLIWKSRTPIFESTVKAQMPWHFHIYAKQGATETFQNSVNDLLAKYPGNIAFVVNDEPQLNGMPATAEAMAWLRHKYPNALTYSNAWPMGADNWHYAGSPLRTDYSYQQYIEDYINIIRPDVMMFDIYPFQDRDGVANVYFHNMQLVRQASLKAGIPYWVFVQAYLGKNRRLPSDSDYRMQVFSSLAFGYTGIGVFTFDTAHEKGLLDIKGEPTPLYNHAVKANREVMNIAGPLRFLTSTEVRFVKRTPASPVAQGLLAWDNFSVADTYIKNISIMTVSHLSSKNGDQSSESQEEAADAGKRKLAAGDSPDSYVDVANADGLIGYFQDDAGGKYFMITNLWHSKYATADQRELSFTLKFDPGVKQVARLSRKTGKAEQLTLQDGEIDLVLPGGTGDLFKVDDASFPGLLK
jgi:hypothetical protein